MLTGLSPWTAPGQPAPPKPDTVNYFFLEQGHVMEYFRFGPADKKIVSLFFGPGEFVLPSHLHFSCFGMLDEVVSSGMPDWPAAGGMLDEAAAVCCGLLSDDIVLAG